MKPDQHKKKRSAQYKKTHGIKDKPSDSQNVGVNDKANVSSSNVSTKTKSRLGEGVKQTVSRESCDQLTTDLYDTEGISSTSSENAFERRKLLSNWDRYEELESDEESQTLRGQDFRVLLDTTAGSQSGFRFKEELDWAGEHSQSDAENDILSINCADIAEAIMCIPTHQRLNISDTLFQKEEIDTFKKRAKISETIYNENFRKKTPHSKDSQYSDIASLPGHSKTEHSGSVDHVHDERQNVSSPGYSSTNEKSAQLNKDLQYSSEKTDDFRSATEESSDSELAFLLSLDTPAASQISTEPTGNQLKDELIDQESIFHKETLTSEINHKQKEETSVSANSDDLEDWLDSVLDS